jgi:hypothetical protein
VHCQRRAAAAGVRQSGKWVPQAPSVQHTPARVVGTISNGFAGGDLHTALPSLPTQLE